MKNHKYKHKYIKYKQKYLNMIGGNSLRLLTYNVFSGLDEKYSKERRSETVKLILELNLDIICLQEATTDFINELNSDKRYHIYSKQESLNVDEKEIVESSGYLAILSKFEIKEKILLYKGGYYDDGILKVILNTQDFLGFDLCIYNVHLSGGTYDKPVDVILTKRIRRMLELDILNQDLRNSEDKCQCIIMGDFNSDANSIESFPNNPYKFDEKELHVFPEVRFYPSRQVENIKDMWSNLRPNDPGFTEDTEKNSFRKYLKKNQKRQARYDQVYYKKCIEIQPKTISLVGTESIGKQDDVILFPSDHFGVFCEFTIIKKIN